MVGGWLSGLTPERDDDDDDIDELHETLSQPSETAPQVLTCRHCGSVRLTLKSTQNDSTATKFQCRVCNRYTTHDLPYGHERCYMAINPED